MKVTALNEGLVKEFTDYYKKYSSEQDESFPPDDDYKVRNDEPVYLLIDENGKTTGAAALMLHREYTEKKDARFRIFHCVSEDPEDFKLLLDSVLPHTNGLNSVYCFVEDKKTRIKSAWEQLGFKIKRYSWILARGTENITLPEFPAGFELKTMRDGIDEDAWCEIINEAFENDMGHVTLYPDKIAEWRKKPDYIAGGMKILRQGEKPVATVAFVKDVINDEPVIFIEAVSVLNSYQGKGLGRNLLRAGVEFAKNYGVNKVMLSVNAENEKAVQLYLNEGFKKEELYICWHYYL